MNFLDRLKSRLLGRRPPSPPVEYQIPKREIARWLPENPVIVEAGAHIGIDTLELAAEWPKGMVHAFEPVPDLFRQLEERTSAHANVRRYPLALADGDGPRSLHLSDGASDGSSSLLEPDDHLKDHPDVTFGRTIEVEAVTLDSWAERNGIRKVDFLWLDLQGAEPAVLASSPRILGMATVIHTEVSLSQAYAGTMLYREFRLWMEARGFRVEREVLPYSDMGNVLFRRV